MFKYFLYISLLLVISSQVASSQNERGSISKRIKCEKDTSQQYALYIPANYDEDKNSALLIFLDPAARGDFPVDIYYTIADLYNVIIAGSYNSLNFNGQSSVESFVAVYNDIVSHYSIDPDQIWIAGFSGGARAAASIALAYPEISGVIACGAGFSNDDEMRNGFIKKYAAIVGDRDMNYSELLDNSRYLDKKPASNILLFFKGGHSWPPVEEMSLAIEWLLSRDESTTTLGTYNEFHILEFARAKLDSGFFYTAWMEAQQISKIPAYKKSADSLINEIENQNQFVTDKNDFEQAIIEEQTCMNDFSLAFNLMIIQNQPLEKDPWVQKMKQIAGMRKDRNQYRRMAGERCFDHCTRTCLEYYFRYINTAEYNLAFNTAEVLSYFNPMDPEPYYYMARAKAGARNKKQSEKWMKEAVKKGFVVSNRMAKDTLLLKIFTADEIKKIAEKN